MRANETSRLTMLARLDCTDLELRAALARLDRAAAHHVDLRELMEAA